MLDRVLSPLPAALEDRVVVTDGAMGTMLPSVDLALDDFAGHEGCDEILTVIGSDGVRAYLKADAETDTFGAILPNGIEDRIFELSRVGGDLAREVAVPLPEPGRIGEEFPLHPEQSTDAFDAHHPEAKYLNVRAPCRSAHWAARRSAHWAARRSTQ
jgi:hypothetical protein